MGVLRIERAAEYLIECRRSGLRTSGLPADYSPRNLDEASRIQRAVALKRSTTTAGYKVGLTSVEAQRAACVAAPIVGHLAPCDIHQSGKRITLSRHHLRVVEAEVIFQMGEDLLSTGAPFSTERIKKSVSAAFAGLEICDSRFDNVDTLSLAEIVADNSNADLLVVGQRLTDADMHSLGNLPVTLTRVEQVPVRGSTARVLGNPLASLTWLANWLAERGEGLKRDQLVASGSCTGITEFAVGDSVAATFGADTRVAVDFA